MAGVLSDEAGRVLLARRPEGKHQGGLWEFPGGKLKPREPRLEALEREIAEELGVDSLGYLSHEGMVDAVAEAGPYCTACFSGDYPAPLVDVEKGFLSEEGPAAGR